jgi:hypothetical protein
MALLLGILGKLSREYNHRLIIVNAYLFVHGNSGSRKRLIFRFTHTHIACLVVNRFVSCNEGGMVIRGTCELKEVANDTVTFVVGYTESCEAALVVS